jgi:hypothetical protein
MSHNREVGGQAFNNGKTTFKTRDMAARMRSITTAGWRKIITELGHRTQDRSLMDQHSRGPRSKVDPAKVFRFIKAIIRRKMSNKICPELKRLSLLESHEGV